MWKRVAAIVGSFKEDKDEDYDLKKKMGFIISHPALFSLQDHQGSDKEDNPPSPTPVSEQEEEEEEEESGEAVEVALLEEDKLMAQFYRPRHLYDILLGLQQSENRRRFMTCLKYVPTVLNQKLPENSLYLPQVTKALLTMNPHLHMMMGTQDSEEEVTRHRKQGLVACLVNDLALYHLLVTRLASDLCSLSDRHFLLETVTLLAQRLSNDRVQAQQETRASASESDFFFRKGKSVFYSPVET